MDIVVQTTYIIFLTGVSGVIYISSNWRADNRIEISHPLIFNRKKSSIIFCANDCFVDSECSSFLYKDKNGTCMGFSSHIVATTIQIDGDSMFYIRPTVSTQETTTDIQTTAEKGTIRIQSTESVETSSQPPEFQTTANKETTVKLTQTTEKWSKTTALEVSSLQTTVAISEIGTIIVTDTTKTQTTENLAQTTALIQSTSQQSVCVSDCTGLPGGSYQSCLGCTVYATCSNGILIDNRPCSVGLYWDDDVKGCVFVSTTCVQ